jgi:hypothetical protein
MEVLNTMTNYLSAFNTIKNEYDIDTLREIRDHGCSSGVANNHIYYTQTVSFYDEHEDEIYDYIKDNYGSEIFGELFKEMDGYLKHYKNALVWTYIELVANTLVEQYEDITCEEMNESFDDVISFCDDTLNQLVTTS